MSFQVCCWMRRRLRTKGDQVTFRHAYSLFRIKRVTHCRSQWPRSLRRWSAASRLLGLRVRIPPGGMDVCCECCVLSGRGFSVGLTTRPESPTECGVSECDSEASIMRRPWPTRDCYAIKKKLERHIGTSSWVGWVGIVISILTNQRRNQGSTLCGV
jgi:hypothetical protein